MRELLSRIAETLYWIGRYVERSDDIARLLDVSLHRTLGDDEDWSTVLAILGHEGGDNPTTETMIQRLAYDSATPSSIAGCVRAARENARGSGRSSPARSGSASTSPGTSCRSGRSAPSGSARTAISGTSASAPPSSRVWPTRP